MKYTVKILCFYCSHSEVVGSNPAGDRHFGFYEWFCFNNIFWFHFWILSISYFTKFPSQNIFLKWSCRGPCTVRRINYFSPCPPWNRGVFIKLAGDCNLWIRHQISTTHDQTRSSWLKDYDYHVVSHPIHITLLHFIYYKTHKRHDDIIRGFVIRL